MRTSRSGLEVILPTVYPMPSWMAPLKASAVGWRQTQRKWMQKGLRSWANTDMHSKSNHHSAQITPFLSALEAWEEVEDKEVEAYGHVWGLFYQKSFTAGVSQCEQINRNYLVTPWQLPTMSYDCDMYCRKCKNSVLSHFSQFTLYNHVSFFFTWVNVLAIWVNNTSITLFINLC